MTTKERIHNQRAVMDRMSDEMHDLSKNLDPKLDSHNLDRKLENRNLTKELYEAQVAVNDALIREIVRLRRALSYRNTVTKAKSDLRQAQLKAAGVASIDEAFALLMMLKSTQAVDAVGEAHE